jgi:hypothetical protein
MAACGGQRVRRHPSRHPLKGLLVASVLATLLVSGCLESHDPCDTPLGELMWEQPGVWDALPPPGEHGEHTLRDATRTGFEFQDPRWGNLTLTMVIQHHEWDFQTGTGRTPLVLRSNETVMLSVPGNTGEDLVRDRFLTFANNLTHAPQEQLDAWADALLANGTEGAIIEPIDISSTQDSPTPPPSLHYHVQIHGPYRFEAHYEELLAERGLITRPDPYEDGRVDLRAWSYEFAVPRMEVTHADHQLEIDIRDRITFLDWRKSTSADDVHERLQAIENDLGLPPLEAERDPFGEWWLQRC